MGTVHREVVSVRRERVILVGAGDYDGRIPPEAVLEELERLAQTAGAIVVGRLVQKLERPHATFYLGSGKAEELRDLALELRADVVIFDNDLSPAQLRNLERVVARKVVDRSELILDIFATRARTSQAKLQVELAQLEYILPRLRRMWTHLDTHAGGIGTRGPGEKQIEDDRRAVTHHIHELRRELGEIQGRREREVAQRLTEFTACLVGYTNSGKSTIMNLLTDAGVLVEDKLFATLDTRTSVCRLDKHHRVLLSDTVGFIRDLPHHLIASFHATLEEVKQSDLLLHIVDSSHPKCEEQMGVVTRVLQEIGAGEKPTLVVFNKIDSILAEEIEYLKRCYPDAVAISALEGTNLDAFRKKVVQFVRLQEVEVEVRTSPANGRLMARFDELAEVLDRNFEGDEAVLRGRVSRRHLGELRRLNNGGGVRVLE